MSAVSELYKASEMLQAKRPAKLVIAYLRYADVKLDTALFALQRTKDILGSVAPREDALRWLHDLDFDRLYREGIAQGNIPTAVEQWRRLSELNMAQGYLGVVDALILDVRTIRGNLNSIIERLEISDQSAPEDFGLDIVRMHSALANFTTFAQMVAYLNILTPLDPAWVRVTERSVQFTEA